MPFRPRARRQRGGPTKPASGLACLPRVGAAWTTAMLLAHANLGHTPLIALHALPCSTCRDMRSTRCGRSASFGAKHARFRVWWRALAAAVPTAAARAHIGNSSSRGRERRRRRGQHGPQRRHAPSSNRADILVLDQLEAAARAAAIHEPSRATLALPPVSLLLAAPGASHHIPGLPPPAPVKPHPPTPDGRQADPPEDSLLPSSPRSNTS